MIILSKQQILDSGLLTPSNALRWVREAFSLKYNARLPHKISITYDGGYFMNTMPCMIPSLNVFGVKVVTRYPGRTPSIAGDLLLYREETGELLALMDATALTAIRTGAVAALAVQQLSRPDFKDIAIMGLGQTGRATLACLAELFSHQPLCLHVLRHKMQAEEIQNEYRERCPKWHVVIEDNYRSLVRSSDVIISCITYTDSLIAEDDDFRQGCLVVPVHTRGFQNCDLFFDKVFADDTAHVRGFQHFSQFKHFGELPAVLLGKIPGRESEEERILSYNIGIALHDIVFAHHLYETLGRQ